MRSGAMFSNGSLYDAFKKVATEGDEASPAPEKPALPQQPKETTAEDGNPKLDVPPVLRCSDCRVTMYKTYFAMAGRPVCAKCRAPYAKAISRGRGPEATRRAVLWGTGAALGCAIVFGGVSMTMPFLRHLLSFGIAYAVTKAVMSATGNVGGRFQQYLTVALTYAAIGLGSAMPVALALNDESVHKAVAQQRANDSLVARSPIGNSAELVGEADKGADLVLNARQQIGDMAEALERQVNARRALAAIHVGMTPDQKHAQQLVAGGSGAIAIGLVMLLVFAPFVGLLAYGVFSGGVGLLLLILSLFKAWRWTEVKDLLELTGPHRVGEGPIPTLY
jgi:hypothetical protein